MKKILSNIARETVGTIIGLILVSIMMLIIYLFLTHFIIAIGIASAVSILFFSWILGGAIVESIINWREEKKEKK